MEPIKYLTCCCCDGPTIGRQWWNRDEGFGLCDRCADSMKHSTAAEDMQNRYGEAGVHYAISRGKKMS